MAKPDDRRDNVEKIQRNIDRTLSKMEAAEDMLGKGTDAKTKRDIRAKNERRLDAVEGMRKEIRGEVKARDKGYQ